jgi:transcriptional regulator with XRE-family HTH domain
MTPTVGDTIRARRLMRGWSVRYAASRAGVSHATWSRIERGRQTADNRFMIAAIAEALECSPTDLAGIGVPAADRSALAAHAGVLAIRQALVDIDLDEPPSGPAPSVADQARTLALIDARRQSCDYAGAARLIPELLRGLHTETAGPDRAAALRLLCEATFIASSVLRNLGCPAEAWVGASRCHEAAVASADPVLRGYAAYAQANAANACGSFQRGLTLAERAIDDLGRYSGRTGAIEVLGSLQLICAYASRGRQRRDDSRGWSAEAAALARRTGETTTMGMFFGPTNVDIWRITIEASTGDPGEAASIARATNPSAIAAGFRQVFYYADTARALAALGGHDRSAIRHLLTAERLAPQHVHTSDEVRATAQVLLGRSDRGSEIRGLCERLRVA